MKTRSETVTEQLREAILQGALTPGEHLQEIPIAASMGVSRTPVRAALNTLAQEGLLDYSPKRGYVVRGFPVEDILAVYEARAALESLACRLVAERGAGEEELARLEECLATGDRLLSKGHLAPEDLAPYRAMNVAFHETIMAASRNPWLPNLVRQTHNIPLASDRVILWNDFRIILRSHDDHHRITHAIRQRQAWRAEALMREHIFFASEVLRDALQSNRVLGADGLVQDGADPSAA